MVSINSRRDGRDGPEMPPGRGYRLCGDGVTVVKVRPRDLWAIVMDEERLAAAIPGAETLRRVADPAQPDRLVYAADVGIGVGPIRGTYTVTAELAELREPRSLVLLGGARGMLGRSSGEGWVDLARVEGGTEVRYAYAILITGAVAAAGGRLIEAAADRLIEKFFQRLGKAAREHRRALRQS